jgi:hypothetical protein
VYIVDAFPRVRDIAALLVSALVCPVHDGLGAEIASPMCDFIVLEKISLQVVLVNQAAAHWGGHDDMRPIFRWFGSNGVDVPANADVEGTW